MRHETLRCENLAIIHNDEVTSSWASPEQAEGSRSRLTMYKGLGSRQARTDFKIELAN